MTVTKSGFCSLHKYKEITSVIAILRVVVS